MVASALLLLPLLVAGSTSVDTFGSVQFLPTLPGSRSWNSAHWANGKSRTVEYASDPWDPSDWTEDHSGSTDGFRIDGAGTMAMSGGSPRFHLNSLRTSGTGAQFFQNTEFTAYYRRSGTGGQAYGGLVVGARSGPLGHASSGGDDCDATTYYARFRDDGKWDFEKELKHPTSDYWSGSGFHTQDPLWGGNILPLKRWIGIKYLVWTLADGRSVHLESWIDSVSGGDPALAVWSRVGSVVDSGQWAAAPSAIAGCTYTSQYTVIDPGHGTFLLRTDGDTAEYRMVSLREIVPPATSGTARRAPRPVGDGIRLEVLPERLRGAGGSALRAIDPSGRIQPVRRTPGSLSPAGTSGP
jgi:hypothetical protein